MVKIKAEENKSKEKEVDQDKIDGEEMIDGPEDLHLIKKEAHQVIVVIKIYKHL